VPDGQSFTRLASEFIPSDTPKAVPPGLLVRVLPQLIESSAGSPQLEVLPVLVVQDHIMLGSAIARVLDVEADMNVIAIARSGAEATRVASRATPAVGLIDLGED
jgi:hypothetical protein